MMSAQNLPISVNADPYLAIDNNPRKQSPQSAIFLNDKIAVAVKQLFIGRIPVSPEHTEQKAVRATHFNRRN